MYLERGYNSPIFPFPIIQVSAVRIQGNRMQSMIEGYFITFAIPTYSLNLPVIYAFNFQK